MKYKKVSEKDLSKLNKKKKPIPNYIWFICIFIGISIIMFAEINVAKWLKSTKQIEKQIEEIYKIIDIEEISANKEEKIINPPKEDELPPEDPYWDYIKLPLIAVNFDELKKKNSDTVAFIKVNGTNINYPVVQAKDNSYYLTHTYDKSYNPAGWVFLDYRNDLNNLDDNSIIYAHGMYNKTMFGSLKNILNSNWYNNTDNYVINISTPSTSTLWQVFSVYDIPNETYYLTSNFGTASSHQKFLDTITSRSVFNFNTTVNINDKVLTLSTCKNDFEKVVLHAKLIKEQIKET